MGKKIILLVSLFIGFIHAEFLEFGKITYLQGEIKISRNNEVISPIISSRVYLNDYLLLENNSSVKIKTNFQSYLVLKNKSKIQILAPDRINYDYGTLYIKRIAPAQYLFSTNAKALDIFSEEFILNDSALIQIDPENRGQYSWGELTDFSDLYDNSPQPISFKEPLWRTAVFPGWGHLYIDNPIKGWPMLFISTYLLYNSLSINPANWHSSEMQEIMNSKKIQFQQTYFVFWSWALLDILSETNNYNKKIMAEKNVE